MSNRHHFTSSTSLSHCDYDNESKELIICFSSGQTYKYPNVPQHDYEALKAAASPGSHFQKNLRPKYKGIKV